jgi:hypothetical protein
MITLKSTSNRVSIEFEEFTSLGEDGKLQQFEQKWLLEIIDFLNAKLGIDIVSLLDRLPYLVIFCNGQVPEPSRRPFLIAGLISIWITQGPEESDDCEPVEMDLGESGLEHSYQRLELGQLLDLKEYTLPKLQTLSAIRAVCFPTAIAISFIDDKLLIELPKMSEQAFRERLEASPEHLLNRDIILKFHNGPIFGKELTPEDPVAWMKAVTIKDLKHRNIYDLAAMDGSQRTPVACVGVRVYRIKFGVKKDDPQSGEYLEQHQGIFVSSDFARTGGRMLSFVDAVDGFV